MGGHKKPLASSTPRPSPPLPPKTWVAVSSSAAASPRELYRDWLDADILTSVIGESVTIEPRVGGRYVLSPHLDGRILELIPDELIVLALRGEEFPTGAPDSRAFVEFKRIGKRTSKIEIDHVELPYDFQDRYLERWPVSWMLAHYDDKRRKEER